MVQLMSALAAAILLQLAHASTEEAAKQCLMQKQHKVDRTHSDPESRHGHKLAPELPALSLMHTSLGVGTNPSGSAAPLTQEGYAAVADRCCQAEMEQFIERVAFDLNLEVCNAGGVKGIAPWHTCDKGPQTYADLTKNLLEDTQDRCSAFASTGKCKDLPADCPEFTGADVSDCHCSVSNAAKLDFTRAYLGTNNLGGVGPDTGTEEMRYVNIFAKAFPVRWTTNPDVCIDVAGGSKANGASVMTWECVDDGTHRNMQWTLPPSGTGVIRWTPNPTKCFQVAGGSTANGANLEMWDCDEANPDQQFSIVTTGSGIGPIKWATHPDKCLNVKNGDAFAFKKDGGSANRVDIQLSDCIDNDANQEFTLPKVKDATDLVIKSLNQYTSPGNADVSSNMEKGFGSLTVKWGTSTEFQFQFVESGTSTPRVLEEFHMAMFDLDKAGDGAEFVAGKGYKGYVTDAETSLSASTLPDGRTKFTGTASVPNPTEPGQASDAQRKASVMFFVKNSSELIVTFGFEGPGTYDQPGQNALLLFSGSSVLVDRCAA